MKKIVNWTFGGFFRTIGRTLAFLVLGGTLFYILSINGFKLPKFISPLRVHASSYTAGYWVDYWRTPNTKFTLDSATGLYYNNTTNFPVYAMLNSNGLDSAQSGNGLTIPANATHLRFGIEIASSEVSAQNLYNTYTFGVYYNRGNLVQCDIVQANNYNRNNSSYTNQFAFTLSCPVIKNSERLTIIYIKGRDDSQSLGYQIRINPNYVFEYDDASQGIQGVIQEQQETNDKIDTQTQTIEETANQTQQTIKEETNKTISIITDNSSPDLNGTLDNATIAGWLPAGPIDSIVNLPLTLLNSLFNAMGGTCAPLTVPLPYVNKNLSIPCMVNVYSDMSFTSFFNWIGVVASAFILYKYLMRLYKWIDATLTLREQTQVDWGGD